MSCAGSKAAPAKSDAGRRPQDSIPQRALEGVVFRGHLLHEVFADYRQMGENVFSHWL